MHFEQLHGWESWQDVSTIQARSTDDMFHHSAQEQGLFPGKPSLHPSRPVDRSLEHFAPLPDIHTHITNSYSTTVDEVTIDVVRTANRTDVSPWRQTSFDSDSSGTTSSPSLGSVEDELWFQPYDLGPGDTIQQNAEYPSASALCNTNFDFQELSFQYEVEEPQPIITPECYPVYGSPQNWGADPSEVNISADEHTVGSNIGPTISKSSLYYGRCFPAGEIDPPATFVHPALTYTPSGHVLPAAQATAGVPISSVIMPPNTLCRWLDKNGRECSQVITSTSLPQHLTKHGIENKTRDFHVECRWIGCKPGKTLNRESIVRHIREVHMGLRRPPKRANRGLGGSRLASN